MGRGLGQQRGKSLHAQVSHSNQRKRGEESVGSPGSFSRPFQVKAAGSYASTWNGTGSFGWNACRASSLDRWHYWRNGLWCGSRGEP